MAYDPHAMKIYVDGSVSDNPGGEGGIAGIVEFPERLNIEPSMIFEQGYMSSTNQRMELLASIKAIEWARDNARSYQAGLVVIVTDSLYLYDHIGSAQYWKKEGWKNRDGRPVENSDLWNDLLAIRSKAGIRIEFDWQKGKTTPLLKEVDRLAKRAREGMKVTDYGYHSGKIARTRMRGGVAVMYPAEGQEETIRIYRKGSMYHKMLTNCKIFFEIFSADENKFIAKHFAYASPEIQIELHRHHGYRVKFNNSPRYPIIETILGEVETPSERPDTD